MARRSGYHRFRLPIAFRGPRGRRKRRKPPTDARAFTHPKAHFASLALAAALEARYRRYLVLPRYFNNPPPIPRVALTFILHPPEITSIRILRLTFLIPPTAYCITDGIHQNVAYLCIWCIITDMPFEWDDQKSLINKEKHGIDFEAAQSLWLDGRRVEIEMVFPGEKRWALIARIEGMTWTAIYTVRGETIRLISVRRARPKEVRLYEEENAGKVRG